MPVNFCHITPTHYLKDYAGLGGAHLILAHLVEADKEYRDYYANLEDGKYKIMDNSAFEMHTQGKPLYESSKLVEMGKLCKADCIVMSDYPREKASKTIQKAKTMIPELKDAGFDTFFCPQSEPGDVEDLLDAFEWGLTTLGVDVIGVSILACPNAFNADKNNLLQRYLSRWKIFNLMDQRAMLTAKAIRKFHCLGMTDGPNEIELLRPYHLYIRSWDSSAAVWAGINGIGFDNTPTGLRLGKFEKEVDFKMGDALSLNQHEKIMKNINYINSLCR